MLNQNPRQIMLEHDFTSVWCSPWGIIFSLKSVFYFKMTIVHYYSYFLFVFKLSCALKWIRFLMALVKTTQDKFICGIWTLKLLWSLYADDTCMYFAAKDPKALEKVINEDLKSAMTWFSNNELLLNVDKCQFMLIGSKSNLSHFCNVDVRLNNKKLLRVMECKYLGVLLDSYLSWIPQINNVKKKVLKTYFALKRMRQFTDEKISLILYKTLIQPHFNYCTTIWMNGRLTLLKQLQTLQNKCLRYVLGVNSRFHNDGSLWNPQNWSA